MDDRRECLIVFVVLLCEELSVIVVLCFILSDLLCSVGSEISVELGVD